MEATVLHQSRVKGLMIIAGCLAFVAIGFWMIQDPDGSSRYSPETLHAIGFAVTAVFGVFAGLAILQVVKPSRLTIAATGLTYEWLWRRQTWPWRDVGVFKIEGAPGGRMIRFEAGNGGYPAIPGGWVKDLKSVCADLNMARERWR